MDMSIYYTYTVMRSIFVKFHSLIQFAPPVGTKVGWHIGIAYSVAICCSTLQWFIGPGCFLCCVLLMLSIEGWPRRVYQPLHHYDRLHYMLSQHGAGISRTFSAGLCL